MPLPRSLANIKREISEKKWAEARRWAVGWITTKKYRMPGEQQPNRAVAECTKRLAGRFHQLKTENCLTGHISGGRRAAILRSVGGARARCKRGNTCSRTAHIGSRSRKSCGRRCGRKLEGGKSASRSGTCSRMMGDFRLPSVDRGGAEGRTEWGRGLRAGSGRGRGS
jgi:hypothetical protein